MARRRKERRLRRRSKYSEPGPRHRRGHVEVALQGREEGEGGGRGGAFPPFRATLHRVTHLLGRESQVDRVANSTDARRPIVQLQVPVRGEG